MRGTLNFPAIDDRNPSIKFRSATARRWIVAYPVQLPGQPWRVVIHFRTDNLARATARLSSIRADARVFDTVDGTRRIAPNLWVRAR